jgi:hypothetical protein
MRRLFGAVAFASTLTCITLAGMNVPAMAADSTRVNSMQFALRTEGPASACADKCRVWVSASGMIRPETVTDFEAFAQKNDIRGATIAFESEGGSVLGAIALGRSIRRLGMTTTVGRSSDLPSGGRATLSPRADCESMCVFVLLGGVKRIVPSEARVRVHQIWLGDRREDAAAAVYSAEDLVIVQRDIGRLAQYTAEMGGAVDLLEVSLRIPPWEPMRSLTREELRRMRLDNVEIADTRQPAVPVGTASPTTASARKISLAGERERGWGIAERSGAITLARSHPLTVEGEEIGSFEVSITCGAKAGEYVLTYDEKRQAGSGNMPDALRKVDVRIGQKTAPLSIVSSDLDEQRVIRISSASGNVPAAVVKALAESGNRSLTVTTSSTHTVPTTIRIGNTGVAARMPQLAASCSESVQKATHAGLAKAAE